MKSFEWGGLPFGQKMLALELAGFSYEESANECQDNWSNLSRESRHRLLDVECPSKEPWMAVNPDGARVNTDTLLRRAEHEISYRAKRAIEMYIPVWEKGPAPYLFEKCAEHYVLCQGEIEQCRALMAELEMVG